ncbi:hypothetical protein COV17_01800 [Candidatus Woesearchaeota archaeon CG10_big_fil_rev_8_21_14_0_10_36_11]|nr:MAG: hypothetical protein COV17_01800 [Candidatus Woesearchaeota archaeon CG10_big_fil_rev_8_21_14_0_10_36_11]
MSFTEQSRINTLSELEDIIMEILHPTEEKIKQLGECQDENQTVLIVKEIQDQTYHLAKQINSLIRGYITTGDSIPERRQKVYQILVDLVSKVDEDHEHLRRVSDYAGLLGRLHIEEHQVEYPNYDPKTYEGDIAKATFLHDLGKICLPRSLLNSDQTFAENSPQKQILRFHVACGPLILDLPNYITGKGGSKKTRITLTIDIAGFHHWPEYSSDSETLCPEKQPPQNRRHLAASIVKIVDVLDARTSNRHHHREEAFDQVTDEIIQNNSPYQLFDTEIIKTFAKHREKFKNLYLKSHSTTTLS